MSTLPFLLSVADELDNLNSQTYMDDFGLGFHPHRHYYRNPNHSIQLSLPASTDWIEEKQRCRSHKFVDDSQNLCDDDADENATIGTSTSTSTSASNNHTSNRTNDQDNIDNTVHMYNLSKKCRKYNHGAGAGAGAGAATVAASTSQMKASKSSPSSSQCPTSPSPLGLTTAISSSDESLQKTSTLSSLASIEFLTCFPVKKNKTPKCTSTSSSSSNNNGNPQHKKS